MLLPPPPLQICHSFKKAKKKDSDSTPPSLFARCHSFCRFFFLKASLSYNKLMQEHQKNSDISPSLRDLEPGYVSNLAAFFETQKVWLRFRPHCHFVIVYVYFRL